MSNVDKGVAKRRVVKRHIAGRKSQQCSHQIARTLKEEAKCVDKTKVGLLKDIEQEAHIDKFEDLK